MNNNRNFVREVFIISNLLKGFNEKNKHNEVIEYVHYCEKQKQASHLINHDKDDLNAVCEGALISQKYYDYFLYQQISEHYGIILLHDISDDAPTNINRRLNDIIFSCDIFVKLEKGGYYSNPLTNKYIVSLVITNKITKENTNTSEENNRIANILENKLTRIYKPYSYFGEYLLYNESCDWRDILIDD